MVFSYIFIPKYLSCMEQSMTQTSLHHDTTQTQLIKHFLPNIFIDQIWRMDHQKISLTQSKLVRYECVKTVIILDVLSSVLFCLELHKLYKIQVTRKKFKNWFKWKLSTQWTIMDIQQYIGQLLKVECSNYSSIDLHSWIFSFR